MRPQVKATLRSLEKVSKGLPEVPGIAELSPNGVSLESLKDVTAEVLKDLGGGEEEPGEEPARAGEGGDAAMGEEEGEVDEPGAEGGGAEPKGVVLGTERDSQEAARAYHRCPSSAPLYCHTPRRSSPHPSSSSSRHPSRSLPSLAPLPIAALPGSPCQQASMPRRRGMQHASAW